MIGSPSRSYGASVTATETAGAYTRTTSRENDMPDAWAYGASALGPISTSTGYGGNAGMYGGGVSSGSYGEGYGGAAKLSSSHDGHYGNGSGGGAYRGGSSSRGRADRDKGYHHNPYWFW